MRVLGIIINLFFPGVGTIVVGKVASGIIQFILYAVALTLTATGVGAVIGIPLGIAVWVWALVSAVSAQDKPLVIVVRETAGSRPPDAQRQP